MKRSLVILDSGAFSVWNKGDRIDLEEYISFCEKHPDISYYVNLDVIPGEPNRPNTLNPETIESACRRGWKNYKRMVERLPANKVIPVFHQNDSHKWLEKYLENGVKYIGISPANDSSPDQKLAWIRSLKGYLFDGAGRPIVKTHGFAVTSYALMREWEWHSVDSASWGMWSTYGQIAVPRKINGEYDYSREPVLVDVSLRPKPKSSTHKGHTNRSNGFELEVSILSQESRDRVKEYLEDCKVSLGKWDIIQKKPGSKLKDNELWMNKKKGTAYRVLEKGVATDFLSRQKVNRRIYPKLEKVLPVRHIYFAGHFGLRKPIEKKIRKRLLSFALMNQRIMRDTLTFHTDRT